MGVRLSSKTRFSSDGEVILTMSQEKRYNKQEFTFRLYRGNDGKELGTLHPDLTRHYGYNHAIGLVSRELIKVFPHLRCEVTNFYYDEGMPLSGEPVKWTTGEVKYCIGLLED